MTNYPEKSMSVTWPISNFDARNHYHRNAWCESRQILYADGIGLYQALAFGWQAAP